MKAAFIERTGGPDVIQYGDLPTPTPRAGEALIKVAAAALNPIDTYIRSGAVAMPIPKPFIVGCDLAGTVEAIGPEVNRVKPGDRVWASNQGLMGRQGTFAEYACVDQKWLHPTPDGVPDELAAAASLVGITAHRGLFGRAGLKPGETVFVNGGTGGVGLMVVQMAKAIGARVITTVGSAHKQEVVRGWGADLAINYKTDDVPAMVRSFTANQGVQVWYETQREPDFLISIPLLAIRGRMVVMAGRHAQPPFPLGPFYTQDKSLLGFAMFNATPGEQDVCAADINRWLEQGKLRPIIGQTFKLAEAAAAHRLQEDNTLNKAGSLIGKIVVTPDGKG